MKPSKKISAVMHKLLIENKMDGFSVVELRNASLSIEEMCEDLGEARIRVYRQILRFEKNGWLRSEGVGQKKRYFQTGLFKSLKVVPRHERVHGSRPSIQDYSILKNECSEHKGELEIVLGEIEEYRSLIVRFPELEPKLLPLLEKAKERSANILGKINVLKNVLEVVAGSSSTC